MIRYFDRAGRELSPGEIYTLEGDPDTPTELVMRLYKNCIADIPDMRGVTFDVTYVGKSDETN